MRSRCTTLKRCFVFFVECETPNKRAIFAIKLIIEESVVDVIHDSRIELRIARQRCLKQGLGTLPDRAELNPRRCGASFSPAKSEIFTYVRIFIYFQYIRIICTI